MSATAVGPVSTVPRWSVLSGLALLVPPALLLQRQAWIVPGTGLGSGLGLVIAVSVVLWSILLFAGDIHPSVAGVGPVPPLLLGWALAITWSFFVWSISGLPQLRGLAVVGYGQNMAEIVFVLGLMAAMGTVGRCRTFVRLLAICGAVYAGLLLTESMSGLELAGFFRLPFLKEAPGLADIESVRGGFLRAQGMAGHPLEAGVVSTILSPLGIALCRATHGRTRFAWGALTGVMVLGSLSTLSRSAMVGLVVALAVMSLRWSPRAVLATITGVVAVVAALGVAAPERVTAYTDLFGLSSTTDSSLFSRQVARGQAFTTIAEHFWAGRGVSSHRALGGRILDNQLLGFAVEQGVPAVVMFVALLGFSAWWLLRVSVRLPRWEREVAIGLAGSLAALLMCSAILDIFGFPQIRLLTFVLLAVVGPVGTRLRSAGLPPTAPTP